MNLHQVLTGAVNPGDHCFSVGSIGDQRFTVSEEGPRVARGPAFARHSGPSSAQNDGQRRERLVAPGLSLPPRAGQSWSLRTKEAKPFRSVRYCLEPELNLENVL